MKIDNLNIQAEKKRDIFKKKKILITILYKWFKYNRVVYWTFVYFYLFIFFLFYIFMFLYTLIWPQDADWKWNYTIMIQLQQKECRNKTEKGRGQLLHWASGRMLCGAL